MYSCLGAFALCCPVFEPHTYSYSYPKDPEVSNLIFPLRLPYTCFPRFGYPPSRLLAKFGIPFWGRKKSSRSEPSDTARGPRKSVLQGILRRRRISPACGTSVVNGSNCQNDHSISKGSLDNDFMLNPNF